MGAYQNVGNDVLYRVEQSEDKSDRDILRYGRKREFLFSLFSFSTSITLLRNTRRTWNSAPDRISMGTNDAKQHDFSVGHDFSDLPWDLAAGAHNALRELGLRPKASLAITTADDMVLQCCRAPCDVPNHDSKWIRNLTTFVLTLVKKPQKPQMSQCMQTSLKSAILMNSNNVRDDVRYRMTPWETQSDSDLSSYWRKCTFSLFLFSFSAWITLLRIVC